MLKFTFLVFYFCTGTLIAQSTLNESAAKEFIIESSPQFIQLYNDMAKIYFDQQALFNNDSEKGYIKALDAKMKNVRKNLTELIEQTYEFPLAQIEDEEIKIGILAIKTAEGMASLGDAYEKWSNDDFDDFVFNASFCHFMLNIYDEQECQLSFGSINDILKNTRNPNEIRYFWKETRERNLSEVRKKMTIFLNLYKKYGEKLQMSPKFAWFAMFLDENFDEEMEKVIKELEPLYKDLHAYIRYILHEQYKDFVPANGLIPHYLYERVVVQIRRRNSFLTKEFKDLIKIPNLYESDGQSVKDMMEIGRNFMKFLGFEELPAELWCDRLKLDISDGDVCFNKVIGAGNVSYLIYCEEVNFKRFHHMVANIAELYYNNEYNHLPFPYAKSYNIESATGKAIALSAMTPAFLHAIGRTSISELSENENILHLFMRGVETILPVSEHFVHSKIIADILDGKIKMEEINEHYWNLMQKYLGVAPSVERYSESIDFPEKFYNEIETNQQAENFVTEIMGYQIYEALCRKTCQFLKNNESVALHNCNFYKHEEAGEALKHMMHLGITKSWKQILGDITGNDNGMTAAAMIEYYSPLQKWLNIKKTEHGIRVGW